MPRTRKLLPHLRQRLAHVHKSDWSRIRQGWQTHKRRHMDQEDQQHESRQKELPIEPRMGQAFTYWQPILEVSPDKGFRRKAETSINSTLFFGCIRVIGIVFVSTWWNYLFAKSQEISQSLQRKDYSSDGRCAVANDRRWQPTDVWSTDSHPRYQAVRQLSATGRRRRWRRGSFC